MTKYGTSPWVDLFPKSRVPAFPRHRGPLATDIAIVGGGLTGCAAAYAFAAAGVRVVLVEQGRIGRGSSGSSSGWISDDPGVGFGEIERAIGLRPARRAWQAWRRAALLCRYTCSWDRPPAAGPSAAGGSRLRKR